MNDIIKCNAAMMGLEDKREVVYEVKPASRLFRVSKRIVSLVGSNRAAIHQVMCDRAEQATLKTRDGKPFFFSPVGRDDAVDVAGYRPLQDELPWMSVSGIRQGLKANEGKEEEKKEGKKEKKESVDGEEPIILLEVLRSGNGFDRTVDRNGRNLSTMESGGCCRLKGSLSKYE